MWKSDDYKDLINQINNLQQKLNDERDEYKDIYLRMKNNVSDFEFESHYLREENKRLQTENENLRTKLSFYEQ